MRTTKITYTCDRCKKETPETRQGFYPDCWVRLNIFDIGRNIHTIQNKELCTKCLTELEKWLSPNEEQKDATS